MFNKAAFKLHPVAIWENLDLKIILIFESNNALHYRSNTFKFTFKCYQSNQVNCIVEMPSSCYANICLFYNPMVHIAAQIFVVGHYTEEHSASAFITLPFWAFILHARKEPLSLFCVHRPPVISK
jgi:hypothetical protein